MLLGLAAATSAAAAQVIDWHNPEFIGSPGVTNSNSQDVAIDGHGTAVAVWDETGALPALVKARAFDPINGWGPASVIQSNHSANALHPRVCSDGVGSFVATWEEAGQGPGRDIWSARYSRGSGWSVPVLLETNNSGHAEAPSLASDGKGNVTVVWRQSNGTVYHIWGNRFSPGTGWEGASLLENASSNESSGPSVSMSADGGAAAVWTKQLASFFYDTWAAVRPGGQAWGPAVLIEQNDFSPAYYYSISAGPEGNATAVWTQHAGPYRSVWASDYSTAAGWSAPFLVESNDAGASYAPSIAAAPNGEQIVVWVQEDVGQTNIHARRFVPGLGWEADLTIETGAGVAGIPMVAMDPEGNAVAVWNQLGALDYDAMAAVFRRTSGWDVERALDNASMGSARRPAIAVNGSLGAVAV